MTEIKNNTRILAIWLFFCAFMVMAMTGIGAVTRLTESGLSITEWNIISGTIPPLTEDSWALEFEKYQATPEYLHKNQSMTLTEFKKIFFWEWFHRLWGRLIGIAFSCPLIFFLIKGYIAKEDRSRYMILFLLGGSQGALGWFMVQSGLVDRPSVSHFRLAAHLALALTIYAALLFMAFRNLALATYALPSSIRIHGVISLMALAITIIWGAFVAGLDAGMIYNSFPFMGKGIMPPELGKTPFLYDPASIQFTHRVLGVLTGVLIFLYGLRWMRFNKKIGWILSTCVCIQIMLGVMTLLSMVYIPIAVTHQMNAVILLSCVIYTLYIGRPSRPRISS